METSERDARGLTQADHQNSAPNAPLRVTGLTRRRRSELLAFLGEAGAARDRCAQ